MFGSKSKEAPKSPGSSKLATEIANKIEFGELSRDELEPVGINFLGVNIPGAGEVIVSWYSHGPARSLLIDGKAYPITSETGGDVELIVSAAKRRADKLGRERLAKIERAMQGE